MIQTIVLGLSAAFVLLLSATMIAHLIWLVPFVPTRKKAVEKLIEAAQLQPHQTVVDLGCGDGRLLIAAERKTQTAGIGYEIAPLIWILAKIRVAFARATTKVLLKNMHHAPLHNADVIFCYLFPDVMVRLEEKIRRECKKGTRIISHTFKLPTFAPIRVIEKNKAMKLPVIYVYEV